MVDNQLIIEMGTPDLGKGMEHAMGVLAGLSQRAQAWKAENLVDDVDSFMLTTGNRTQRSVMFVVHLSHEQLEQFVNNNAWIEWMMYAQANCPNFTSNRSVDVERVFAAQR